MLLDLPQELVEIVLFQSADPSKIGQSCKYFFNLLTNLSFRHRWLKERNLILKNELLLLNKQVITPTVHYFLWQSPEEVKKFIRMDTLRLMTVLPQKKWPVLLNHNFLISHVLNSNLSCEKKKYYLELPRVSTYFWSSPLGLTNLVPLIISKIGYYLEYVTSHQLEELFWANLQTNFAFENQISFGVFIRFHANSIKGFQAFLHFIGRRDNDLHGLPNNYFDAIRHEHFFIKLALTWFFAQDDKNKYSERNLLVTKYFQDIFDFCVFNSENNILYRKFFLKCLKIESQLQNYLNFYINLRDQEHINYVKKCLQKVMSKMPNKIQLKEHKNFRCYVVINDNISYMSYNSYMS